MKGTHKINFIPLLVHKQSLKIVGTTWCTLLPTSSAGNVIYWSLSYTMQPQIQPLTIFLENKLSLGRYFKWVDSYKDLLYAYRCYPYDNTEG